MKRLIAEFEEQSFTQIIFPHEKTDWASDLKKVQNTFIKIINSIIKYQKCLVVCDNKKEVSQKFAQDPNLFFVEYTTDDTWARDCSALCVSNENTIELLDFNFNAWGNKFSYKKDNQMTSSLAQYYSQNPLHVDFVLEGGAIESNGEGIILTTAQCIFNKNRNKNTPPDSIKMKLKEFLGAKTFLYLHHGYLAGDDTDSHIDTLVRFIGTNTLMYVQCQNEDDEHYIELFRMEKELQRLATQHNFTLIPLPLPSPIFHKKQRLPATYANFLFVNGAVLVPTYGVKEDEQALTIFKNTFSDKNIVPIDCSHLIKQHGSLHCVTMNFASGIKLSGKL